MAEGRGPRLTVGSPTLTHLETLEVESIHIIREVAAEMQRPCVLFSGGKDSAVLLYLATRAFGPAPIPFPVLHVDTGLNFADVLQFRDDRVADLGVLLVVASVPDAIERGLVQEEPNGSRNRIQTPVLLEAVEGHRLDALFGGARRDEEKARAKERIFSFRDAFGQWDPKSQRPEPWSLYNGRVFVEESMRVFPLSNWTELDIWHYLELRSIPLPAPLLRRRAASDPARGPAVRGQCRHARRPGRGPGDRVGALPHDPTPTLTGCVRSSASTVAEIIAEIAATRNTERATRGDDRVSETSMEDRKRRATFERRAGPGYGTQSHRTHIR